MKSSLFAFPYSCLFIFCVILFTMQSHADLTVTTNTWWPEGYYSFSNLTIQAGATLFVAGGSTVDVLQTLTVTGSGSAFVCDGKNISSTNASGQWVGAGVVINAGTVVIDTDASVNADGQGYTAHGSGQNGSGPGGGVVYSSYGGGGGYGGQGGQGNDSRAAGGNAYGSSVTPREPGSAGGNSDAGHGGGAIQLRVQDTLTINGRISANGIDGGSSYAGAGAGGSVWIETVHFGGAGSIEARGGDASSYGGGGSGGRVAVYYENSSFSGYAGSSVDGGIGWNSRYGERGTMAFFDTTSNRVYVTHSRFELAPATNVAFTAITVTEGGDFSLYDETVLSIGDDLSIEDGSILRAGGGSVITVDGTIAVRDTSVLQCRGMNVTGQVAGVWAGAGVIITALHCVVEGAASINSDGFGYSAGGAGKNGNGPGGGVSFSSYGGGGGHGGSGGRGNDERAAGGPVYDDPFYPRRPGSGGANSDAGHGGGSVWLVVRDTLTLNGRVSANGEDGGSSYAGAGSGGALLVDVQTISGTGVFQAAGGNGGSYSGGGGGGSIAVYYDQSSFLGYTNSNVNGGVGWNSQYAQRGTMGFFDRTRDYLGVYQSRFVISNNTDSSYARISADNGAELIFGDNSLITVTGLLAITRGSSVSIGGGSRVAVDDTILLSGASDFQCRSINATGQVAGTWIGQGVSITAGMVWIEAGSSLNADSQGYTANGNGIAGNGPGGGVSFSSYGGGGGYGGRGGRGNDERASGGLPYGDPYQPVELGSAGGNSDTGYGGGAMHMIVGGVLTLNGRIGADGIAGNGSYAGGGSGGSVWIETHGFTGSGFLEANGGAAGGYAGGGSGGRIAVYYDQSSFSGYANASVAGGIGWNSQSAQRGTLIFIDRTANSLYVRDGRFTIAAGVTSHYSRAVIEHNGDLFIDEDSLFIVDDECIVDDNSLITIGGGSRMIVSAALILTNGSSIVCQGKDTDSTNEFGQWTGVGVSLYTSNLLIDAMSSLNADGQGYTAAGNSVSGNGPGGGVVYSSYGGGGGYGGNGGRGNDDRAAGGPVYGDVFYPMDLGSGGGNGPDGHGGGALHAVVWNVLHLDGRVSADGNDAPGSYAGAGSGGSILMETDTLSGSGVIHADGGGAGGYAGGGAGGRVAVYCLQNSFNGYNASTVNGGIGWNSLYAQKGTMAFFDTDDNTLSVYGSRFVFPAGLTSLYANVVIEYEGDVSIEDSAEFTVENMCTLRNASVLTIGGGSALIVNNTLAVLSNSSIICEGRDTVTTNAAGEWIGVGVSISATNIIVETGSMIHADGQGYLAAGNGLSGAGPGGGVSFSSYGGGGGYGGVGGRGNDERAAGGPVYGDVFYPVDLGSAGANGADANGGGAIRFLVHDTFILDGRVSADGSAAVGSYAGGGSGGSILIETDTLSGSGVIHADGGGAGGYAGGGAGGRVAVYYLSGSFGGYSNSTVNGGTGWNTQKAQKGTMAFFDTDDDDMFVYGSRFVFADGLTAAYADIVYEQNAEVTVGIDARLTAAGMLLLREQSSLTIGGGSELLVQGELRLTSNAALFCNAKNVSTTNDAGQWTGIGSTISATNFSIDATSVLSGDGRGYVPAGNGLSGAGPGGGISYSSYGGGGGHGGLGGDGNDSRASGGVTNGLAFYPVTPGSSGGNSSAGYGGGAIKINVGDVFLLDGTVSANGSNGDGSYAGAGAGGSLYVETFTLAGSGAFSANGGSAGGYAGGGAGGRIAVYYMTNLFSGMDASSVDGGTGRNSGEAGTILFYGPRERFFVSAGSEYCATHPSMFVLRGGNPVPVGARVQCLASGTDGDGAFAPPATNGWNADVADGTTTYGYFTPAACREDRVRLTWMGDDNAETKAPDAGQPGFVTSSIGFWNRTRMGWLRAFSAGTITGSAFYADTHNPDTTLNRPGAPNFAWQPAQMVISNVNPAYHVLFDAAVTDNFEYLEGSVYSTVAGGDNLLQSSWLVAEYRYAGSAEWRLLDDSLGPDGDFSGKLDAPAFPTSAWVRVRVKDEFTNRNGFPVSQEFLVADIPGALVVEQFTTGTILTNAWPVRVRGSAANASRVVLSNLSTGVTYPCTGTTDWQIDLTGNNNSLQQYRAVAFGGSFSTSATASVTIDHDNIPPAVTMIAPVNNATSRSTTVSLTFSATDDRHAVAFTEISTNSGLSWFLFSSGETLTFPDHSWQHWRARATDNVPSGNTSAGTTEYAVYIFEEIDLDVLCVWPRLIGATQTGWVEYVTDFGTGYEIYADDASGSHLVAAGSCVAGWNLVPFYGGDLPGLQLDTPYALSLKTGDQVFNAGEVTIVADLSVDPKVPSTDDDNDQIYIKYSSKGGTIRAEGRTLYIENGTPKDKISVKVKAAKGSGDGLCTLSGIITDSGFGGISVPGTLERLEARGAAGKVQVKGGNLGLACATRRFFVTVDGPREKSKGTVMVQAGKNKSTGSAVGGNIYANILCGVLNAEPYGVASRGGLKMVAVKGGSLGIIGTNRWLWASSIGKVLIKGSKVSGGSIADYSLFCTDEVKAGSGLSIGSILASTVLDSSGVNTNTRVVCGHRPDINPLDVTDWTTETVTKAFGKLTVKGAALEGAWVITAWPKGSKGKCVKTKGNDSAAWIVGGTPE